MSTIEPSNALDHTLLQIQNCGHKVDSVTWKNRLVTRFKLDQDDQDLLDSASFARRLGWNCPDCNAPIDKFFHPAKDRVDQINMVAPVLSKERVFIEAQDLILNKNCLGLNQEELEYCREVADRLPKGEDPRTQRDSFELWWEVIPQGSIVPREFNTALKNLLKNLEEAESRGDKYWIKTHKDHLEECIAETVQHWYNPDLPYRIALYRLGGMQDSENDLWNSLKELKEICPFHSLVDRLFEKLRHHVASLSHCFLGSSAEIGKLFKHYPNLHHIEPRFTTEEAFYAFLDILRSGASPLTSIKFPYSGVSHEREEMAAIIDALRENTTIRKVSLGQFRAGDCELPLSELIRANSTLEELYFWACNLTDRDLLNLADALNDNTSLHTLELGRNRRALSRDIWSRFFETLCPSRPFKLLSLRCTLPDVEELFCDDLSKGEGLVDLGGFHSYLKANPPIQQLDLSGLRMRQPDAEKLIEALKEAVQIQDLRLNTNVQPAVYSKDLLVAFARERGILKLPPCSSNFPDSPHRSTRIPLPKKHVDYEPDQMACAAFMISLGGPGDRYELMGVEGCAQRFLEEGIGVRDGTNYRERVCDAVIEAMLEIRKGEYKAVGGELLNIVRKSLRKYEVPEDVLLEMLENAYGPAVWSTWREITKLLKESVAS